MFSRTLALATFSLIIAVNSFAQGSKLSQCGAIKLQGDATGMTDSSPALLLALEQLAQCGGGTLEIGHGKFKLETTVSKNFSNRASKITIRGQGSNSQVVFATGSEADGMVLQNLEDLTIQGITFAGSPNLLSDGSQNPAAGSDVFRAIHLQSVLRARIQNNMFYGIAAPAVGAAIIKAVDSHLTLDHNQFLGSAASQSGVGYGGVVFLENYIGMRVINNAFIDYGTLNGVYYSKTPLVWTTAWILLMNPAASDPESARSNNAVEISYNQFDEGAVYTIINNPEAGSTVTRHMILNYNTINVGIAGGYYLRRIKHLDIRGGWAGFRHNDHPAVDAIVIKEVELASIRDFETDPKKSATGLNVDANTLMLRMIDSRFKLIVNHAKAWRIEDGSVISSGPLPPDTIAKSVTEEKSERNSEVKASPQH